MLGLPAVKQHLSYDLQAPLHSVCSVKICLLGSSLSAKSVSSATMWQLSCNVSAQLQYVSSPEGKLYRFEPPAMCQPSFDMSAQLRSDSCTSKCRLGNLSALAADGQLSCSCQLVCHLPSQLQAAQVHACQLGCSQSALLHSVTSFAALPCFVSDQAQSVSSAVFCQLSCNLSAVAYSVMQFIL